MRSDPALERNDTGYVPQQTTTMYNIWADAIPSKFLKGLHPDFSTLAQEFEWVKDHACHRCDENGDNESCSGMLQQIDLEQYRIRSGKKYDWFKKICEQVFDELN